MRRWIKILPWLSLVLCILTSVLWWASASHNWHFRYSPHAVPHLLWIHDQTIRVDRPPGHGHGDLEIWNLASRIRNSDIDWFDQFSHSEGWGFSLSSDEGWSFYSNHSEEWTFQGTARPGSNTRQLYQLIKDIVHQPEMTDMADPALLAAVHDRDRFVPAHLFLSFQTRKGEAYEWEGMPHVILPGAANAKMPDLSHWKELADQWSDQLDVPVFEIWIGWIVLVFLILPCAMLVRPRGPAVTTIQRACAGASLVSLLALFLTCVGFARSYGRGDEWDMAAHPLHVALPAGIPANLNDQEHVEPIILSCRGQIQILALHEARDPQEKMPFLTHSRDAKARPIALGPTANKAIESHWKFAGISYTGYPTQTVLKNVVKTQTIAVRRTVPVLLFFGPTITQYYSSPVITKVPTPVLGAYSLTISYRWLIVVLLVMPLWWLLWILPRRRRAIHRGLCLACGFDLRATPERCPECGLEVKQVKRGNERSLVGEQ